jgi:crossover junction endodeoxyribonuclease RusA
LVLPFPPSVNTYWGFHGSHRFLTNKAKAFKCKVAHQFKLLNCQGLSVLRLKVTVELCPPDKRIRDLDNYAKSLLDALCQAGVFEDDSQIDYLLLVRGKQIKGGQCLVSIQPYDCQQGIECA